MLIFFYSMCSWSTCGMEVKISLEEAAVVWGLHSHRPSKMDVLSSVHCQKWQQLTHEHQNLTIEQRWAN